MESFLGTSCRRSGKYCRAQLAICAGITPILLPTYSQLANIVQTLGFHNCFPRNVTFVEKFPKLKLESRMTKLSKC